MFFFKPSYFDILGIDHQAFHLDLPLQIPRLHLLIFLRFLVQFNVFVGQSKKKRPGQVKGPRHRLCDRLPDRFVLTVQRILQLIHKTFLVRVPVLNVLIPSADILFHGFDLLAKIIKIRFFPFGQGFDHLRLFPDHKLPVESMRQCVNDRLLGGDFFTKMHLERE
ncbi:MAG: hypothetical protein BWY42_01353 [Candidatus Omnitrophica bacterium ADurb.Bin277]|nr:MAG: hypothetical protein BWY42_01353 [Candidatus Omnitrophica bacterium ADurb.Bin277]